MPRPTSRKSSSSSIPRKPKSATTASGSKSSPATTSCAYAATTAWRAMLEREDFRSRLTNNQPISVHELLYPLLTAYDAVALKSDVEIARQSRNSICWCNRDIQREYGVPSEVALTMPISSASTASAKCPRASQLRSASRSLRRKSSAK